MRRRHPRTLRSVELRHLRYFVALAQTQNFTRAAELVHVTQSTLSHQIGQLEAELGTRLFVRMPRGVQLTPEGESFLAQSRRALEAIDAGIRSLHSPAPIERHPVRLGATPSLAASFIAPAVAPVLKRQPGLSVTLLDMTPERMRDCLLEGSVDLGVAYPPLDTEGLTCERLFTEELVVTVGPQHALAKRRRVHLADLHGRALIMPTQRFSIRRLIDEFFHAAGAEPVIVAEVDGLDATLKLLQALDAAALFPAQSAPPAPWRSVPVERPFASRVVTLYRRAGESLRADVKAMHKELHDAAARSRARKPAR